MLIYAFSVFERLVLRDLDTFERNKPKIRYNLNREQMALLKALAQDSSITIKPADKGGGLVILDSDVYDQEVLRQLNDCNFYLKLEQEPTSQYQKQVRVVLSEGLALDQISKDLYDFLYVEYPRVPLFYVLPKIHKPGFPPKGRPIVAANAALFENISKYIDSLL